MKYIAAILLAAVLLFTSASTEITIPQDTVSTNMNPNITNDNPGSPAFNFKFGFLDDEATGEYSLQDIRGRIFLFLILMIFLYLYTDFDMKKKMESYYTELRISDTIHEKGQFTLQSLHEWIERSPELTNKEKRLKEIEELQQTYREISTANIGIDAGQNFALQLIETIEYFSNTDRKIVINSIELIDWDKISVYKKVALYRVIQELLVNMKKHSDCTIANISITKSWNRVNVRYSDNGSKKAIDQKTPKKGMQLMEKRLYSVGGRITFDTNKNAGFSANFFIPIYSF